MKDIFALHPQMHLRRSQLYQALEPLGFTRAQVNTYISAGLIKAKHLPHARRARCSGKKASRSSKLPALRVTKSTPALINGRAFYVVRDVIAGLQLKP